MARGGGQVIQGRQPQPQQGGAFLQTLAQSLPQVLQAYQQQQQMEMQRKAAEAEAEQMRQQRMAQDATTRANFDYLRNVSNNAPGFNLGDAVPAAMRMQIAEVVRQGDASGELLRDGSLKPETQDQLRANQDSAGFRASQLASELKPKVENAHKGDMFMRAAMEEIQHLPEVERQTALSNARLVADAFRSGVQDSAIADLVARVHPNIQERARLEFDRSQVAQAADQRTADSTATPVVLRMLAESPHIPATDRARFQALAAIPGLTIWGAGGQLLELQGGREETARFLANAIKSHEMAMTEIGARNAGFAGGSGSPSDWAMTIFETARNRSTFGPTNLQGDTYRPDLATSLEEVINEMRPTGLITPQVEAEIRGGIDAGVFNDVQHFQSQDAQRADWPDILAQLRQAQRTPEHIEQVRRWLSPYWIPNRRAGTQSRP